MFLRIDAVCFNYYVMSIFYTNNVYFILIALKVFLSKLFIYFYNRIVKLRSFLRKIKRKNSHFYYYKNKKKRKKKESLLINFRIKL